MTIKANSYITDIINSKLSNVGYVIAIVCMILIMIFSQFDDLINVSKTVIGIILFVFVVSMIIGSIARIISGNNYWIHISEPIHIKDDKFFIDNKTYNFDEIKFLKFNIGKVESKKPFIYEHFLKDTRNMIKFKTNQDIIQVHFILENENQKSNLIDLKRNLELNIQ